jgi:threonine synthase
VNIGRLLPQMVYYFHAAAQLPGRAITFSTPSGNFGNLTAGLIAKRSGLAVERFVAATNANDIVPVYLTTGRFEPRASVHTLSNAMDVGNPSNFERMSWLYGGDVDGMRRDIHGTCHTDDEVQETIRLVYERRGYLLDPHSAIGYMGLVGQVGRVGQAGQVGVFLATAHPAKFAEIVEPIIGKTVDKPAPLAHALARPRHIIRIDATLQAVKGALGG